MLRQHILVTLEFLWKPGLKLKKWLRIGCVHENVFVCFTMDSSKFKHITRMKQVWGVLIGGVFFGHAHKSAPLID